MPLPLLQLPLPVPTYGWLLLFINSLQSLIYLWNISYTPQIFQLLHTILISCAHFQLYSLSVNFENLTNFNVYKVNKPAYQVCLREMQKETRLLQQKLFMYTIKTRALPSIIPRKIYFKQLIKNIIFFFFQTAIGNDWVNELYLVLVLNIHFFL